MRSDCVAPQGVVVTTPSGAPPEESVHPATVRASTTGSSVYQLRLARPARQRRVLVVADSENDTEGVQNSLRFAGLVGKRGKFKKKASGAQIVQTGDLLHKNAPDPAVVVFWDELRTAAERAGCSLHIVAGNHELEIWRRLRSGERLGLKRREQRMVEDLIRTTRLFHVEGSMLFIHGYPTVKLLSHMHAYRTGTGKDLNDYNQDFFQPALDDSNQLAQYAYPRRRNRLGCLLHDITDPERYYRRHGKEVAGLLTSLGIDLVVHGHRPERSGVQADFEFARWLPGVRMISNDVQLRVMGLGGTVIRQVGNDPADLLFVNKSDASVAHRSHVRKLLRDPSRPNAKTLAHAKLATGGEIFAMIHDHRWEAPVAVEKMRASMRAAK